MEKDLLKQRQNLLASIEKATMNSDFATARYLEKQVKRIDELLVDIIKNSK